MAMIKLNIHEIKAQLSKYIEMVEKGETVVVCKRNIPVAEIRPIEKEKKKPARILGSAKGMGTIPPEFYEPMSEEELQQWEGDENDPLRTYMPDSKESQE